MSQVDRVTGLVGYSGMKIPCDVCSTTDLTLTGEQSIDGVTTSSSRVLVTGQTDQTENGIWVSDTGDWVRAQDCDGPYDLRQGSVVYVYGGTSNGGFWYCTTANTVDIGTDNLTFSRASTALAVVTAFGQTLIQAANATAGRLALGVVIGTDVQAYDADLSALAGVSSTGVLARTGAGTAAARTLTGAGKVAITNGDGVSGNPTITGALPRAYLAGCTLSNNGTDATNDIDIAVGECRDSTIAVNITVAAMTKQLDANWSPGTNLGMRYSGAAIANTTYHIWAVSKADGTQDIYATPTASASTASAALTLLQAESGGSSYVYARRIGSILRESAAIVSFTQVGDRIVRTTPTRDVNNATPGTSANTGTLSVPLGITVVAQVNVYKAAGGVYVSPLVATDAATSTTDTPLMSVYDSTNNNAGFMEVLTNTSGQMRYRSDTNATVIVVTLGWIDRRGRDD